MRARLAACGRFAAKLLRRPLVVVAVVVIVVVAGTTAAAYAVDRIETDHILPGITVAGVDVGGMNGSQAASTVQTALDPQLRRTLAIEAGPKTMRVLPADLGVRALVGAAVQQALRESQSTSWLPRSYHRLFGWSSKRSIAVRFAYPTAQIAALVAHLAAKVDRAPQNAALQASSNDMSIVRTRARAGRSLRRKEAVALLLGALQTRAVSVRLPVAHPRPKVTAARLGETITVDLSTNTLRLYDGLRVVRTYPVATAMSPYSTPVGTWHVVGKEFNPVWVNPGTAWAASMPKVIPPGPANPLGLRALQLDAPGILIHGTPEDWSIGHWASHGCVRMHEYDAIALYPLVPVGTRVIIFGAPPWGASTVAGAPPGF